MMLGSYQLSHIYDQLLTATGSSSEQKLVRPFWWKQMLIIVETSTIN